MALQHVIERGSQPSSLTQGSSHVGQHSEGQHRGASYGAQGASERIRESRQHGNLKKMVVAYNGSLDQHLPKSALKSKGDNLKYHSKNTNGSGGMATDSMDTLESHKGGNERSLRQQEGGVPLRPSNLQPNYKINMSAESNKSVQYSNLQLQNLYKNRSQRQNLQI